MPIIAGCYSMLVQCDYHWQHEYGYQSENHDDEEIGNTKQDCIRTLRRRGWVFKLDGTVQCRNCKGRTQVVDRDADQWSAPAIYPARRDPE